MIVPLANGVTTNADDAAIVANIVQCRTSILDAIRVPRETENTVDLPLLSKN